VSSFAEYKDTKIPVFFTASRAPKNSACRLNHRAPSPTAVLRPVSLPAVLGTKATFDDPPFSRATAPPPPALLASQGAKMTVLKPRRMVDPAGQ
jgi:hypothetical protein